MMQGIGSLNFCGNIDYFYECLSYGLWEIDLQQNLDDISDPGLDLSDQWALELVTHLYAYGLANGFYNPSDLNDSLEFYLDLTKGFVNMANQVRLQDILLILNCKNISNPDSIILKGEKAIEEGKK